MRYRAIERCRDEDFCVERVLGSDGYLGVQNPAEPLVFDRTGITGTRGIDDPPAHEQADRRRIESARHRPATTGSRRRQRTQYKNATTSVVHKILHGSANDVRDLSCPRRVVEVRELEVSVWPNRVDVGQRPDGQAGWRRGLIQHDGGKQHGRLEIGVADNDLGDVALIGRHEDFCVERDVRSGDCFSVENPAEPSLLGVFMVATNDRVLHKLATGDHAHTRSGGEVRDRTFAYGLGRELAQ